MKRRCFDPVARLLAGVAASKEWVLQKIAEAKLSGGEVDMSAYPSKTEVENMIAENQTETDINIAALHDDTTTLRLDCDNNAHNLEQVMDDLEAIKTKTTVTAFPRQDSSIEGAWLKYAEYKFPCATGYETTDLILLVRNRVATESPELGILAARLRYNSDNSVYQFYSLRWLSGLIGIDTNKFAMCVNAAEGIAELYVRCDTKYTGYVFTAIAMGTGEKPHDMTAWTLEDTTVGSTDLPSVLDSANWVSIMSQV